MPKLKELDDQSLLCKMTFAHAMEPRPIEEWPLSMPKWGIKVLFFCPRCGTYRLDIWDRMGRLTYRRYATPDHYKVDKAKDLRACDYRREYMRRLR